MKALSWVLTGAMSEMAVCEFCVMDKTDLPFLKIPSCGRPSCSSCSEYYLNAKQYLGTGRSLQDIVHELQKRAKGNYHAVLGISGGVDSTYVAYLMSQFDDLDVLLVHLNDGWNSDKAEYNVKQIVKQTGYDYEEIGVDTRETKDITLAYLKAGVLTALEALTDNLIMTAIHDAADKHGLNNIIGGSNYQCEGVAVSAWQYSPADATNIRDIHKKFGTMPLKNTKLMTILRKQWRVYVKGIWNYRPLNHVPSLNIFKAKETLCSEWDFQDYHRKHGENRYTRFVTGYILPHRLGIDKRKQYYSSLICSGQMSRTLALDLLKEPPYSEEELEVDKEFFMRKLSIDDDQFDALMLRPVRSPTEFKTHKWDLRILKMFRPLRGLLRR